MPRRSEPVEMIEVGFVRGSPADVWSVLIDEGSWRAWWPADVERPVVARWDSLRELGLAADSAGAERGVRIQAATAQTTVHAFRRGSPLRGRQARTEAARLRRIVEALTVAVEARVRSRGDVPDVDALRAAGNVDRLASASHHREPWVRARALLSLPRDDPRTLAALLEALEDPVPKVRWAAGARLERFAGPRVDDALGHLRNDPDPEVRDSARKWLDARRRRTEATDRFDPRREQQARLASLFGEVPVEAFLDSSPAVMLRDEEAFGTSVRAAMTADEPVPLRPRVSFPPLCSGCLEATERHEPYELAATSEVKEGRLRRRVHVPAIVWPVPLCERCRSYGLGLLTRVAGHDGSNDGTFWLSFRFANVAYVPPFAEANGADGIRIVSMGDDRPTPLDAPAFQEALAAWAFLRDGIGFHRYVALKQRLADLDGRSANGEAVSLLAAEFSLPPERLRDVEVVARRRFTLLDRLDVPSGR